eukprot:GILJ01002957.1.p1 GENE.GILJ01002957.1~~GILJ01002957.1.p1  ORF type:complete len:498 (+),score=66.24 GILJ01002957.1:214-1707(+)
MSITSDEVNFLVYRYLLESGFRHAAYTFGYESLIAKSNIKAADVPPGALVSFLQKGLQYIEIEAHLADSGKEIHCDQPFTLLTPHTCRLKEKKEAREARESKETREEEEENEDREEELVDAMEEDTRENHVRPSVYEITDDNVTVLNRHTSDVFICSWHPKKDILASGSGDSTARLWSIPEGPSGTSASELACADPVILQHFSDDKKSKEVTTLDWNADGTMLATGSYDGQARIWNESGDLLKTLRLHQGPILTLKWNKAGTMLLSGSIDRTSIVWDVKTWTARQQFAMHEAPTLDVDWRTDNQFASCSTDKMIYVCELDQPKAVRCWSGHTDEVNVVKWNPQGSLLASCSDDCTAKLWDISSDNYVMSLNEHHKEIYAIKWSPTGPGTRNPNKNILLATASFDSTVKLWDIQTGRSVLTFEEHTDPVYSVAFSPDGEYMASGSFDRCLHIWSVKDGRVLKTYRGQAGIFEVCWNAAGNRVAACFSNNTVCVLDFRM